jgi:hypothetical protein
MVAKEAGSNFFGNEFFGFVEIIEKNLSPLLEETDVHEVNDRLEKNPSGFSDFLIPAVKEL